MFAYSNPCNCNHDVKSFDVSCHHETILINKVMHDHETKIGMADKIEMCKSCKSNSNTISFFSPEKLLHLIGYNSELINWT